MASPLSCEVHICIDCRVDLNFEFGIFVFFSFVCECELCFFFVKAFILFGLVPVSFVTKRISQCLPPKTSTPSTNSYDHSPTMSPLCKPECTIQQQTSCLLHHRSLPREWPLRSQHTREPTATVGASHRAKTAGNTLDYKMAERQNCG
ncbi:unnamed protein product [Chilo suppressalis]|uniref:Uncharacterized protein n=1 Tax=Chilo suppressalis TaxID=168631 RepID=A0ABN8L4H6_CHISP|nr:unnamed protein product [Chilo suppressalis]